jgi:hypothetical protein
MVKSGATRRVRREGKEQYESEVRCVHIPSLNWTMGAIVTPPSANSLRQKSRDSTGGDTAGQTVDTSTRMTSRATEEQTRDRQRIAPQAGGWTHQSGTCSRGVDVNDATIEHVQPLCEIG